MKFSITLSLLLFSLLTLGQDLTEIKSSLEEIRVKENGLQESGKCYYNPKNAGIIKIKKEVLNKVLPEYGFYSVFLEGYLGYHKISSRCLVLNNSTNGELKIIEPIWNKGISSELIRMIIGFEFENEKELQLFILELQDILLIGSKHNKDFRNTVFSEKKITFDLYDFYKKERIWRKIEIRINKNKIKHLASINPITKKKRIIKK